MDDVVAISYDGFNLNSAPYKITEVDPYGSPSKTTKTYPIARQHGSVRVFQKYDAKTITITGEIICSSRIELELAIDALKKQMRRQEGVFKLGYADGYRQWICTAKNVGVARNRQHISYAPFSIEFECESPFSTDGNIDTLINNENITDGSTTFNFDVLGTFDAAPDITLQINDIDPDDSPVEMILGNSASSEYLTITQIFTAGDTLTIDSTNQRVFLNGELLKVDGLFPEWAATNGNLEYSDNASDRDINITMTAERRFL